MSFNRRELLQAGSLAALAAALAGSRALSAQQPSTPPPAAPPALDPKFTELRGGVGIFTARGGTIGWYAAGETLVVVDTQFPDSAALCLQGLRQRSPRPLAAVINTHHHPDHTAGNGVFSPETLQIVAHTNVPELQRRAAEQRQLGAQTYPTTTFSESLRLDLGSEILSCRHFGPAHTGGDIEVLFERA